NDRLVRGIACEAQRIHGGIALEEARCLIGRTVVDDDQLERLCGEPQAIQAGARQRNLIVDRHDEGDTLHHRCLTSQRYGIALSKGSHRSISHGSWGSVAQLATMAGTVPTPLKPFQIPGGIVTSA